MTGILYFSSTGNSLYIAEKIQETMGARIIYIPNYDGDGSEFDKIVIVCPIYSFGLPAHVYGLIPKLTKDKPVYFVLNYGGMTGGADYFTYTLCYERGIDIRAVYTVKMPENFTLTFSVPDSYMKKILKDAPERVEKVALHIKNNNMRIPRERKTKSAIYLKNKDNWRLLSNDFSINDNCTLCGKCISICPVDNIALSENCVVFLNKCVACLGCYHRCPNKAICYKNKNKKNRYINPFIKEDDIGHDK